MKSSFWKDKKVFVTGHTGFKGSWLCMTLAELGAQVYGYSIDVPTTPSFFEVLDVKRSLKQDTRADINNLKTLKEKMQEANPDVVFHLAAQALVRESYALPIETYMTNVIGTLNVLEAVRSAANVKSCLIVTTDKCYENNEWFWGYRESDKLGGHDPYSSSKACAEIATKSFRMSFLDETKIRVSTARAGNVIGGGDWSKDRIMTDIFKAISSNQKLVLRNPAAIRPWQHVLEPISAYIKIAELNYLNKLGSDSFNVGPDSESEKNVGWVANQFYKEWGHDFSWQQDQAASPHEAKFLKLDNSKIKSLVGWKPALDIFHAVEMTASWYKTYAQKPQDVAAHTRKQIQSFLEKN